MHVNCVDPGVVDMPMLWSNPNVRNGTDKIEDAIGRPKDIAAAILFQATEHRYRGRGCEGAPFFDHGLETLATNLSARRWTDCWLRTFPASGFKLDRDYEDRLSDAIHMNRRV